MRQLDWNRLRLFVEIVRAGNLTRAASQTGLRKAKLSRDLSLLEQEIGAQLVYRTTRQFRLTHTGQEVFDAASNSLEPLHRFLGDVSQTSSRVSGHLRITCPEDVGQTLLVPILNEFRSLHPEVTLDVHFTSDVIDLVAQGVDLGIRIGRLSSASMLRRKIGSVRLRLVCSKSYFDATPPIEQVEELVERAVICFSGNAQEPVWNLTSGSKKRRILLRPVVSATSYSAVLDFALKGHGIALLPDFLTSRPLGSGELVHVLKDWASEPVPIQLVQPEQQEIPIRARALSDLIVRRLKEHF